MKKILGIDENETNLFLLSEIVKIQYPDFKFLKAKTGLDGLGIAKNENLDLILLDISSSKKEGYQICKVLKNDSSTENVPVIIISALGDESAIRINALRAGAEAIISKPFTQEELITQIDVVLRIKEAENSLKKKIRENQEYQKKLKRLNQVLIENEERERKRIAQNVHDGLGQTLSFAYMKLSSAQSSDYSNRTEIISETLVLLKTAVSESRNILDDLSPRILHELGLYEAIKFKLDQIEAKNKIRTKISGENILNENAKFNIFMYRIIGELLTNSLKHARASQIEIDFAKERTNYIFRVIDNGVGFDRSNFKMNSSSKKFGLMSILERIESINGGFNIESKPGKGTKVTLLIPINRI